ncbi:DUF167 domain-containing protein [Vulcanococcus sp.]|jgi:uncharacterized protein (TIGR00251 family)|uniref:DUF167 domain-containing protein n=1 Tax=Vulcanococcus sp. TaxID=2856995 RepID=UPI0037D9BEF7
MEPASHERLVAIRLQPRASRDRVLGLKGDVIAIALKAPPVEGAANAALLKLLARQLNVPLSAVELVRGATGRSKWIRVNGWSVEQVRVALLAPGG